MERKVKVHKISSGSFQVTLPKPMAEVLGLSDHDRLIWELKSSKVLLVRKE